MNRENPNHIKVESRSSNNFISGNKLSQQTIHNGMMTLLTLCHWECYDDIF